MLINVHHVHKITNMMHRKEYAVHAIYPKLNFTTQYRLNVNIVLMVTCITQAPAVANYAQIMDILADNQLLVYLALAAYS